MTKELTLAEMETHKNLVADDRSTWHVFSDDPVMQRRMAAIGANLVRESADGIGKYYELRADQVVLRAGKRSLSDARKAQLGAHLRALRATPDTVEAEGAN